MSRFNEITARALVGNLNKGDYVGKSFKFDNNNPASYRSDSQFNGFIRAMNETVSGKRAVRLFYDKDSDPGYEHSIIVGPNINLLFDMQPRSPPHRRSPPSLETPPNSPPRNPGSPQPRPHLGTPPNSPPHNPSSSGKRKSKRRHKKGKKSRRSYKF